MINCFALKYNPVPLTEQMFYCLSQKLFDKTLIIFWLGSPEPLCGMVYAKDQIDDADADSTYCTYYLHCAESKLKLDVYKCIGLFKLN